MSSDAQTAANTAVNARMGELYVNEEEDESSSSQSEGSSNSVGSGNGHNIGSSPIDTNGETVEVAVRSRRKRRGRRGGDDTGDGNTANCTCM